MPALGAGIHVFQSPRSENVDGRIKSGHDVKGLEGRLVIANVTKQSSASFLELDSRFRGNKRKMGIPSSHFSRTRCSAKAVHR
jgi:hypothetical protein